jgi:RND family efflux transporter MFP subunit
MRWSGVSMVFSLWLAGLLGCSSSAGGPVAPQDAPLPVLEAAVLTVEPSTWPMEVRSQGSLVADEVAVVGAKVAGRVDEVHVDLGDLVRAGEPLVSLDREDFRLQVAQADAQLAQARSAIGLRPGEPTSQLEPENAPPVRQERALWEEARANLQRAEKLRAENATTPAEFDQVAAAERVAEARYSAALNGVHERIALIGVREAELSLARERLLDAVIRAPFDGLVQQRQSAPGAYTQVGDPIVTLIRTDPLRYRGTLPERHAQALAVGQEVRLTIESEGAPRMVRVTRISPALDLRSRSLLFEAEVENRGQQLRSGLFAEAAVVVNPQAKALVVPRSAVVEFAGTMKVWKVVDGVAKEQEVLIGERRPMAVEILQGLVAGDKILSDSSRGRVARIKPLAADASSTAAESPGKLLTHDEGTAEGEAVSTVNSE